MPFFVLTLGLPTAAQVAPNGSSNHKTNSLSEINYRDRALLLVQRSAVVLVDQTDQSIVDRALRADPEQMSRHQYVYTVMAKKLNRYIRKYKSLSAANAFSDADFIILFNLVENRNILNSNYPFGELFVIINSTVKHQRTPRVVWKSSKILWVADAIDELLRDLKAARGEI